MLPSAQDGAPTGLEGLSATIAATLVAASGAISVVQPGATTVHVSIASKDGEADDDSTDLAADGSAKPATSAGVAVPPPDASTLLAGLIATPVAADPAAANSAPAGAAAIQATRTDAKAAQAGAPIGLGETGIVASPAVASVAETLPAGPAGSAVDASLVLGGDASSSTGPTEPVPNPAAGTTDRAPAAPAWAQTAAVAAAGASLAPSAAPTAAPAGPAADARGSVSGLVSVKGSRVAAAAGARPDASASSVSEGSPIAESATIDDAPQPAPDPAIVAAGPRDAAVLPVPSPVSAAPSRVPAQAPTPSSSAATAVPSGVPSAVSAGARHVAEPQQPAAADASASGKPAPAEKAETARPEAAALAAATPDGSAPAALGHGAPHLAAAPAPAPVTSPPAAAPLPQSAPISDVTLGAVPNAIGLRSLDGGSRFDIRLSPDDLGRVDVRLEVAADREVRVHLAVEKPETLALLARDRGQLERVFEQAGLKPSEDGIAYSLRDGQTGGGAGDRSSGNPEGRSGRAAAPDLTGELAATPAASTFPVARTARRSGIDLVI